MFYLMAFLSLLVGVLVYMLDPAPMDLRRTTDINTAEVFVAPFLNQHQAAKDYVTHWLSRIYPGRLDASNVNESWVAGGANVQDGFTNNAAIISLPAKFEDFMPRILSKRSNGSRGPANKRVDGLRGGNNDLGYASALMCMNSSNNLTPCYNYICCSDGTCTNLDIADGCASEGSVLRVNPLPDAKRYVITYGVQSGVVLPTGYVPAGNEKALRQDLWVRAMANRSHNTASCGFLVAASAGSGWCYNRKQPDSTRVQMSNACPDGYTGPFNYCVNNGYRCMAILPTAVETYLKQLLNTQDLSDVFFCMSPVVDSYERIAATSFHYDGVDYRALGAWKGEYDGAHPTWYPVNGALTTDNHAGLPGRDLSISDVAGGGMKMPFNQSQSDFTLSFVMQDAVGGDTGPLLNTFPEERTKLYGMDITVTGGANSQKIFSFYPNQTTRVKAYVRNDDMHEKRRNYAWTVMRRNNKMYLFLNGCMVQDGGEYCWDAKSNSDVTEPLDPVTFGPLGGGSGDAGVLKDVRYYNYALKGAQLKRNFQIDVKRYGVLSADCNTGDLRPIPDGKIQCGH